ncbi:hypothetical protein GLYMA_09G020400v4 [Glycine max]|uniref:Uncharacterized protein n=1 Tax=Glycine max TaxID=3847 RepID=K7LBD6_SOYBN|nr:hypothetical protein JHK87_023726 [Glycine soja]KAG5005791.1 hypothetical protein JHK85_024333 [Glycine max]KAH1041108.1 hypothetical protein GYH30_023774 [Glycine max]KRH36731.1 hypothetical protein GLYMA_09G020400v4 [Glycine max]
MHISDDFFYFVVLNNLFYSETENCFLYCDQYSRIWRAQTRLFTLAVFEDFCVFESFAIAPLFM